MRVNCKFTNMAVFMRGYFGSFYVCKNISVCLGACFSVALNDVVLNGAVHWCLSFRSLQHVNIKEDCFINEINETCVSVN